MPAPCWPPTARRRRPSRSCASSGCESLALWRETYPGVTAKGTLVVAGTRDRAELVRFARMTDGFETLDARRAARAGARISTADSPPASTIPTKRTCAPADAMRFLLDAVRAAGVDIAFGDRLDRRGQRRARPSSTAAASPHAASSRACAA